MASLATREEAVPTPFEAIRNHRPQRHVSPAHTAVVQGRGRCPYEVANCMDLLLCSGEIRICEVLAEQFETLP